MEGYLHRKPTMDGNKKATIRWDHRNWFPPIAWTFWKNVAKWLPVNVLSFVAGNGSLSTLSWEMWNCIFIKTKKAPELRYAFLSFLSCRRLHCDVFHLISVDPFSLVAGKTRTHCGSNIADLIMFLKCWLVLPRAKHFWRTQERFLKIFRYIVSARRATLPHFATDGQHRRTQCSCHSVSSFCRGLTLNSFCVLLSLFSLQGARSCSCAADRGQRMWSGCRLHEEETRVPIQVSISYGSIFTDRSCQGLLRRFRRRHFLHRDRSHHDIIISINVVIGLAVIVIIVSLIIIIVV